MEDPDKQNDLKKSHLDNPPQISKAEILSELFTPFSEKESNKEFDIMKEDLISYVALQENDKNISENLKDEWVFKNLLYSYLEKNLIEIMYINKKEYRKDKIIKIFNWYQNQLKTFKDLRFINHKSYNDLDAVQDEDYFKEKLDLIKHEQDHQIEDDILKEQLSHRNANFDKSLLDEFKRNHVYDNIFYKKIHKNLEKKSKMPKIKKKLKPDLEKPDRPVGTHTMYYSYKDGTRPFSIAKVNLNDKKILDLAAGGERERTFHTKFGEKKYESVVIDKEIKSSYSYYRPNMEFSILNAEKKIAENKNKFLNQKRSDEELNKNLKDFGRIRAQYKSNEEKKCELKKLVNIYTNSKKLDTALLSKYRKNNFINKPNIPLPGVKEEESQVQDYALINRVGSVSIKNLTPFKINRENKLEKKFYSKETSEYDFYLDPEEEKKKKIEEQKENMNFQRTLKKKYTFSQLNISKKFRRIDGDKIITNEAKNMDKNTKEILKNSKDTIPNYNINLKFKKLDVKQKLINDRLNQAKEEEKKFPNDLVYKLVIDEPVFGQKLTYNKLCNLNSGIVEHKNQNESFSEDESIYNNFCLSAYNIKNNKILSQFNKKFDSDVKIMRHISSYTKFKDKKKLINRSESFDNYRYDYLNLRKTIGEFKKYEYQEIIDRLNKKKENKEDENKVAMKFKDPLVQKIYNIRYRRQKVLSNALMNPNEGNTFPRYFLPRTGSSLISKNEPPPARKKKRRGRR